MHAPGLANVAAQVRNRASRSREPELITADTPLPDPVG
jgi:hypothetical protein